MKKEQLRELFAREQDEVGSFSQVEGEKSPVLMFHSLVYFTSYPLLWSSLIGLSKNRESLLYWLITNSWLSALACVMDHAQTDQCAGSWEGPYSLTHLHPLETYTLHSLSHLFPPTGILDRFHQAEIVDKSLASYHISVKEKNLMPGPG